MKAREYPSQAEIRETFIYCETGQLYWREAKTGRQINRAVGYKTKTGYVTVTYNGLSYLLHRLIYIYHNGNFPKELVVDHISGDNQDNRRENLQAISHRNNTIKQKRQIRNSTGFRGVHLFKRDNNYLVSIGHAGKNIKVGYYNDIEEAARAYDKAALEHHGKFAQLNFYDVSSIAD